MQRLISYAQNAEDIVLWRTLGTRNGPGSYVDIGACHPTGDSVTKLFYERGWRGVSVEPLPALHRALEEERPEDVNLNVGVSDLSGTRVLHYIPEAVGLSTMNAQLATGQRAQGRAIEEIEVTVRTLAEIVAEHVHDDVDFLKIDVEGHEREVLLGADWSSFRPRVVVIEATFPETWEDVLVDAGYRFTQYDGINNFYVRSDEEETLGPNLRQPATVMDLYDPWHYVSQLRASAAWIDALTRERDDLLRAKGAEIAVLTRQRDDLQAQRAALLNPDVIAGRELARALGRRIVSRGRQVVRGRGR